MQCRRPVPSRSGLTTVGATLALLMVIAGLAAGEPARAADDDPRTMMARMSAAMQSLNYEGVLTYTRDDRAETLRVVHGLIDGVSHERVRALSENSIEVIRHGEQVACIIHGEGRALIGDRGHGVLPASLAESLGEVTDVYRVRDDGEGRVAGRPAHVIHVEPNDHYRFGYRLWLDAETSLLLRSDLLAPDGSLVERLMFTELEILDDIPAERFDYSLGGLERVDVSDSAIAPSAADVPVVRVDERRLPAGFHQVGAEDGSGAIQAGRRALFSDGLASVSVFIESPDNRATAFEGMVSAGSIRMHGRRADEFTAVAVGAVPEVTLRRIVGALRLEAESID